MNNSSQASFLLRECPTCKSKSGSPIVSSTILAEDLSFKSLKKYWNGFFKEKIFFSYTRCANCATLYCPVFFKPDQLKDLYASMEDNTAGISLNLMKKTQNGYYKVLKQFSDVRGEYLEIGPDIGLFTERCIKDGQLTKYWLFEPNTSVWPQLSRLAREETAFIISPDMFKLSIVPDHSVNVGIMIHVLDHLLDPAEILKEIRSKLAPNAILICVTHDESSLLAKVMKSRWPPYCLQHPQLYNPCTVRTAMEEAGFEVLTVRKTVNYFPLSYLIKHIFWAFGIKINFFDSAGGVSVPLKLGNIITVARA
jgi:hypothetical protein